MAAVVGLVGLTMESIRPSALWLGLFLGGAVTLLLLALKDQRLYLKVFHFVPTVGGALLAIIGLYAKQVFGFPANIGLALTGVGVVALALGLRAPREITGGGILRFVFPVIGHSFVLAAIPLVYLGGTPVDPAPLYVAGLGFVLLFIDGMWMRRQSLHQSRPSQSWEAVLLIGMDLALIAVAAVALLSRNGTDPVATQAAMENLLRFIVFLGIAMLAAPPALPQSLHLKHGGMGEFLVTSVSMFIVLNSVVILLLIGLPGALWPLFFALTAFLVFSASFEYWGALHTWRRNRKLRHDDPVLIGPLQRVTVVVSAKGEAQTVAAKMRVNLRQLPGVPFLLVLGGNDPVGHRILRQSFGLDQHRVRIMPAPGLSKATDLSQAWNTIQTPFVFTLDADETLDEPSLRIAMKHMEEQPLVGIVQGRKVSGAAPGTLNHIISAERRFSTVIDHTMFSDVFGAAHFAGSGALIRREVPGSVGGWKPTTLTEDIEFTLRIHLKQRWAILYDNRISVIEEVPRSFSSLVRQRGRWARGWSETLGLHGRSVLKATNRLGWLRPIGLVRQLSSAVSAPWTVFLPTLGVLWIVQGGPILPPWLSLSLALYILPSRFVSYIASFYLDPRRPKHRRHYRALRSGFYGYLWIGIGWLLQLHALYLELSYVPRTWLRTRESAVAIPLQPVEPAVDVSTDSPNGR